MHIKTAINLHIVYNNKKIKYRNKNLYILQQHYKNLRDRNVHFCSRNVCPRGRNVPIRNIQAETSIAETSGHRIVVWSLSALMSAECHKWSDNLLSFLLQNRDYKLSLSLLIRTVSNRVVSCADFWGHFIIVLCTKTFRYAAW